MARTLDTRARTVWPKGQGPAKHLKGSDLAIPAGVADRYSRTLRALTLKMVDETERELLQLFRHPDVESYFAGFHAMDISPASQARILTNKLQTRFEQLFATAAPPAATSMADQANKASQVATETSLRKLSSGLSINTDFMSDGMREFLKATIANNVSLIKSIPSEFFRDVQQAVLSSITDGKGTGDLTDFFRSSEHDPKYNNQWERRANNIALDQTRKTYNGLNRERLKKVGVNKFQWIHSGGGFDARPHHIDPAPGGLNGGIFSYDKLPIIDLNTGERGIPGQAINCKCTMRPVIELDNDANSDGPPIRS